MVATISVLIGLGGLLKSSRAIQMMGLTARVLCIPALRKVQASTSKICLSRNVR